MRKQKALSLLMALSMCITMLTIPAQAADGRYDDTAGHWAEASIERWSQYNIVEGNNGHFDPDLSLTRGQMAKVLANTLGLADEGTENPFADMSADAWYAPYVLRCYAAGIMMGDGTNANPDAPITREEAMVMLCRALGIAPAEDSALDGFTDRDDVADWAAPYVAAMVQSGVVSGVGNETLAPAGNITRASLMTILDRSIVQYINEPGEYELESKAGIVLVAAGDVTLTGKTEADVLVTHAADGKDVAFDKATITGDVTVQADSAKVTSKSSKLPDIGFTGEGSKIETVKPTPSAGGSSGGSSGGGHTHRWGEWTSVDESTHTRVCASDASHTETAAHRYDKTSCEEAAVCTVCGYEKAAGAHMWDAGVVKKAANCTEAGEKVYTCSSCHTEKTEVIAAMGHTEVVDAAVAATCTEKGKTEGKHCPVCNTVLVAQEEIAALGHTEVIDEAVAATCTEKGKTEGKHCSVCNTVLAAQEEIAALGHTWNDGIVTTEPTATVEGVKTYTCTVCNTTKTEKIPATGSEPEPTVDTITLIEEPSGVYATWSDYGSSVYYLEVTDSAGNEIGYHRITGRRREKLTFLLPLPEVSGKFTYGLKLHDGADERNVLARLDNAIMLTVVSQAADYDVAFNTPQVGEHTITVNSKAFETTDSICVWRNADGRTLVNEYSNYRVAAPEIVSAGISDGATCDLRFITESELREGSFCVIMTPQSLKTYHRPVPTNTIKFTTSSATVSELEVNWDYAEPENLADVRLFKIQFSEDGGSTWAMENETYSFSTKMKLVGTFMKPGTYNKMRVVTVDKKNNENLWFEADCSLTITGETPTTQVAFEPSDTDGFYKANVSGLPVGEGFYRISLTDDPSSGMQSSSGGTLKQTTNTSYVDNEYFPEGYYRIDVYRNISASGATASMVMQEGTWEKCIK